MRRVGLQRRLAKLERKTRARRWPKVCAAVYDCTDEKLIGVEGWLDGELIQIARQPEETLQALATRAFAELHNVLNIAARYAAMD